MRIMAYFSPSPFLFPNIWFNLEVLLSFVVLLMEMLDSYSTWLCLCITNSWSCRHWSVLLTLCLYDILTLPLSITCRFPPLWYGESDCSLIAVAHAFNFNQWNASDSYIKSTQIKCMFNLFEIYVISLKFELMYHVKLLLLILMIVITCKQVHKAKDISRFC